MLSWKFQLCGPELQIKQNKCMNSSHYGNVEKLSKEKKKSRHGCAQSKFPHAKVGSHFQLPRTPAWYLSYPLVLGWTQNPKLPVKIHCTSCLVWHLLTHRHILARLKREIYQSGHLMPRATTLFWALQLWAGHQSLGLAFHVTSRNMQLITGPLLQEAGPWVGTALGLLTSNFQLQNTVSKTASTGPALSIWSNIIFCPSLFISEMLPADSSQTLHHINGHPLWISDSDLSSLCVLLVPAAYQPHHSSLKDYLCKVICRENKSICLTM